MDRFPIELWQQVGEQACLDGGYTGCSLSLVSHAMRNAVQRVRYTSVAITSQESCLAFASLLGQTKPRFLIRHLFISYHIDLWGPNAASARHRATLEAACAQVLARAAPTLITLSFHEPVLFNIVGTALRFPYLLDLSVPHLYRLQGQQLDTRMFPAVERLHISQSGYGTDIDHWEDVVLLTPAVTALRLTGVRDKRLPPFLRILLDAPVVPGEKCVHTLNKDINPGSHVASRSSRVAAQLPNLLDVIVQPQKIGDFGWREIGRIHQSSVVSALHDIVRATRERTAGGRRLWAIEKGEKYDLNQARSDWADAVNGGDGPWKLEASMQAMSPGW